VPSERCSIEDRILWMGVLCLVTWCTCTPHPRLFYCKAAFGIPPLSFISEGPVAYPGIFFRGGGGVNKCS
jgi:hypothetical protein